MSKPSSASILLSLSIVFLLLTVVCKPATGAAATPCKPSPCQGKQSWPELVGKDPDTAYLVIRRENPQVTDVVFLVSGVLGHDLDKKGVLGAAGDGDGDGNGDVEFCCNRVVVVIGALPTGGEGVTKVPKVG